MLLLGILTGAAAAHAAMDIAVRPASEAPFELLRPRDGEVLEAGRESVIAWRPLRDLSREGIREWEAFLSLDGGRHWPVRITPHLDVERTSFRFTLPLVPSDRVRLMLRFGDEQREVGYVAPIALRSAPPQSGAAWLSRATPTFDRGEVARPGVPGIVLWVDDGGGVRHGRVQAAVWRRPGPAVTSSAGGTRTVAAVGAAPASHDDYISAPRAGCVPTHRIGRPTSTAGCTIRCIPLLLLLCRRNE